jgi:acyl-CoA synthetase (AMP-forming)/AMP-acid ligase II
MTISDMLAKNAAIYTDETALVEIKPSENKRFEITWKEYNDRANRIANALIDRGIGKGDRVIHLMMNSISWLEVYFGIIRTGAWAVPLNFRFTSKDIKYCADIAEAKVIIYGKEFIERIDAIKSQLHNVVSYIFAGENILSGTESLNSIINNSSPKPTGILLGEEDACGLYFTSGTTGQPKPILLSHKNMKFAAIVESQHHFQKHDDNFILLPPLYHTGAKMHWFGSLITGSRATLLKEISPRYIFEAVDRERGTIVWLLVPWVMDILEALDRGELNKEDYVLRSWRLMHIGAQPVPSSLIKRWKKYFPNIQYDTNYGLSESTGPGCIHLGIENEHKVGAIGKAGYNWQVRIVDDKGKDVAKGKVGEIIVKGDGVMKEYYRNPEKTSEAIKDGWLYTGDMAKMENDGFIYFIDRKKDVVITGGENIFPIEIEGILLNHPKIYDAAVIGIPDDRLGEIAIAVVDPKPDINLTKEEVMTYCQDNIPKYKRPRHIVFDKVPRNPTGKIEKPKLREKYSK